MSEPRYGEDGVRLCDQKECEFPATHTMVWTENWQCYCLIHANKMLGVGDVLGFPTPRLTIRLMTSDEMLPDA